MVCWIQIQIFSDSKAPWIFTSKLDNSNQVELKGQHWTIGSCLDVCVDKNCKIYSVLAAGPVKRGWCKSADSMLAPKESLTLFCYPYVVLYMITLEVQFKSILFSFLVESHTWKSAVLLKRHWKGPVWAFHFFLSVALQSYQQEQCVPCAWTCVRMPPSSSDPYPLLPGEGW